MSAGIAAAALEPSDLPALVLGVTGLIPLGALLRRSFAGRPLLRAPAEPFRPAPPGLVLLWATVLFVLYHAGMLLVGAPELGLASDVLGISIALGASAVVAGLARRAVLLPRGSLAWRVGMGLLFLWAALPLVYGTFYLGVLLGFPTQPMIERIRLRQEGWQALVAYAILVAPVAEEICFRALLYPVLRGRIGPPGAIALTSVAFALIHVFPATLAPLAILGAFLAYLVEKTGSVVPAVAAHAAFNALAVGTVLLF